MIDAPSTPSQMERRLNMRLWRYWQSLCQGRAMPTENDIDPEQLGDDWDYCFLLQSRDIENIQDYNFTYLGSRIMRAYFDRDLDAQNQFMVGPNAYRLSSQFKKVITSMAPILDEGEFQTITGRTVLYRQALLPLGTPDIGVAAIFGGMNYKIKGS